MSEWLIDAVRKGPLFWKARVRLGLSDFRWVCGHRHLLESRAIRCAEREWRTQL